MSFKVDRPKENDENDCLVLETPKSRRKKNRVLTLIQAFNGVADMKKGNEDCLVEQEEIRLQEEEVAKIANEEIGELERENKKLTIEVRLLKAENGMLRKKTQEFSALNENLREEVLVLNKKEKEASTNLEDLAKLVEEFEE